MRLEQLYRIRFTYSESWGVGLEGGWEQLLFLAEGRCEGSVSGRFRGANFPQRRTADGPYVPDFRAVIETDDGATVLAPVVAGTLPLVGINGFGAAVGAMSLSARDERIGIPRALVARDVLDARHAADATARATRPGRAGGYT